MPRSLLDLPRAARVPFAIGYVMVLVALVLAGQLAPDHVFGFQMFNESSSLEISLFREIGRGKRRFLVRVPGGVWSTVDARGERHTHRWHDRVPSGSISHLDRFAHASYGLEAQLFHLERALVDLAAHVPDDRETRAFVAVVRLRQNGRVVPSVTLRAVRR